MKIAGYVCAFYEELKINILKNYTRYTSSLFVL